ncbi:MAG: hypothetical protein ACODUE_08460 [Synechococcus sp.]
MGAADYYDVVCDNGRIVLTPLHQGGAEAVRRRLSWLRHCRQSSQLVPVLAEPTARELLRVLAYPKFRLASQDRERLLEDLLPWSESATVCATPTIRCSWIWPWQRPCRFW